MNRKKWTIGLTLAAVFALLSAGSGLAGDMSWKSFIAVLCTSLLTNLGAYLMKHPVEEITDTTITDRANGKISGNVLQDFLTFIAIICLVLIVTWLLSGCASFKSTVTETEGQNGFTNKVTVVKARTFFDSKSELAKLKAGQTDKGQTVSVGSLNQESSGTNATALIEGVVSAAIKAAIKP